MKVHRQPVIITVESDVSPFKLHQTLFEDRSIPDDELRQPQPFVHQTGAAGDRFVTEMCYEYGQWSEHLSPEQTAYSLAQATAANILPPLTRLTCGDELLDYQVRLRDVMNAALVAEIGAALRTAGADDLWQQVQSQAYACVIGAGVAAHLDMTPGSETLSLRYANALVPILRSAHRAAELPRSRLFLQAALYERFDMLLARARANLWFWLAG